MPGRTTTWAHEAAHPPLGGARGRPQPRPAGSSRQRAQRQRHDQLDLGAPRRGQGLELDRHLLRSRAGLPLAQRLRRRRSRPDGVPRSEGSARPRTDPASPAGDRSGSRTRRRRRTSAARSRRSTTARSPCTMVTGISPALSMRRPRRRPASSSASTSRSNARAASSSRSRRSRRPTPAGTTSAR